MRNRIQLIGSVYKAPEQTATTKDLKPVVRFAIAQSFGGMDTATQKGVKKDPQWFPVTCFASIAEKALNLNKDDLVLVSGELRSRSYQTNNNEVRTSIEIIARDVFLMRHLEKMKSGDHSSPEEVGTPFLSDAEYTSDRLV
jgi:single-stranded DNA-binding protein